MIILGIHHVSRLEVNLTHFSFITVPRPLPCMKTCLTMVIKLYFVVTSDNTEEKAENVATKPKKKQQPFWLELLIGIGHFLVALGVSSLILFICIVCYPYLVGYSKQNTHNKVQALIQLMIDGSTVPEESNWEKLANVDRDDIINELMPGRSFTYFQAIFGPAGVGKSTLALQLARKLKEKKVPVMYVVFFGTKYPTFQTTLHGITETVPFDVSDVFDTAISFKEQNEKGVILIDDVNSAPDDFIVPLSLHS